MAAKLMIIAIVLFCITAANESQSVVTSRFTIARGPVLIGNASSTELLNFTGMATPIECLAACQRSGCLLASLIPSSERVCQLLLVNDASQAEGPPATHVHRAVGSEAGARLWVADDFKDLMRKRMLNVTIQLKNSSTGRSGSVQSLTIPSTGCYRIEVSGARGGTNSFSGKAGGRGAFVSGRFNLTAGTQLSVVVGQVGGPPSNLRAGGGGGGGSFVYKTADETLLAAAGGGGAGTYQFSGLPGEAGVNGSDGDPHALPLSFGGSNGQPGFNDPTAPVDDKNLGGCGAGWLGKPVNPRRGLDDGEGGGSRADGWIGGAAGGSNTGHGGFGGGGGGGAWKPNWGAAGAGGGFSGGGSGYWAGPRGGSFCSGSGCSATTGGNAGEHGLVAIRLLEPLADSCE